MVNIEKDCCIFVLKIEKHPVISRDAEGKSKGKSPNLLYVKTRVPPVMPKSFRLRSIKPLDMTGEFCESTFEVVRPNNLHSEIGGYCLRALP